MDLTYYQFGINVLADRKYSKQNKQIDEVIKQLGGIDGGIGLL